MFFFSFFFSSFFLSLFSSLVVVDMIVVYLRKPHSVQTDALAFRLGQ